AASVLAIVLMIVLFYSGKHPMLIPIFYDYRIFLFGVIIFFSIKEYREYYNGGILHFWEGLVNGFITYLIVAMIAGAFIWLFSIVVPDFLDQYVAGTIKGLELDKQQLVSDGSITITEEEYQKQVALLRTITPSVLTLDYIIKSLLIGFPLTLILSVFLRRTEDRFKSRSTAE
ncbi:DUF4199 domain-containing protein, partial [Fulvivirga sp. RKSG066]|uniref:DUF4199 domain-containing protein n=1 Tax=Fulvivirga aurantia TaxID=2529383 RepID=UPI0012BD3388